MTNKESTQELRPTGRGMAHIAVSKKENDFTFIVGGHRYDCPWFVADFLSPRVGRLHANDPSACELVIGASDAQGQFNDFLSLGRGCAVSLTSANRPFFLSVAVELENFELYWQIQGDFSDSVTFQSFCSTVENLNWIDFASPQVISFIASHFFEMDRSFLSRLPISTLSLILSQDSLRIESEDSLYEFVISACDCCAESSSLLDLIRFE
jgi:hypothetical protein